MTTGQSQTKDDQTGNDKGAIANTKGMMAQARMLALKRINRLSPFLTPRSHPDIVGNSIAEQVSSAKFCNDKQCFYNRKTMFKHNSKYLNDRRRASDIPAIDPFSASALLERPTELRGLEVLSWPRNLTGDPASIDELMCGAAHLPPLAGRTLSDVCQCGCSTQYNVSQTLRHRHHRGLEVLSSDGYDGNRAARGYVR